MRMYVLAVKDVEIAEAETSAKLKAPGTGATRGVIRGNLALQLEIDAQASPEVYNEPSRQRGSSSSVKTNVNEVSRATTCGHNDAIDEHDTRDDIHWTGVLTLFRRNRVLTANLIQDVSLVAVFRGGLVARMKGLELTDAGLTPTFGSLVSCDDGWICAAME